MIGPVVDYGNSRLAPRRVLALDRDGVIFRLLGPDRNRGPRTAAEEALVPGIREFVADMLREGFSPVIATNQPDIERGLMSLRQLRESNSRLFELIPSLLAIYVCPHDASSRCVCRKPKPGMLLKMLEDFSCLPSDCAMVGDTWKDVRAAHSAGLQAILYLPEKIGTSPIGKETLYYLVPFTKRNLHCPASASASS